jgi:predicted nucleic acid-binding protein
MAEDKLVVDASVVVKCYCQEGDSLHAVDLIDRHLNGDISLFAPELLSYELPNALRYSKLEQEFVSDAIDNFYETGLNLVQNGVDLSKLTTDYAFRYGITCYDASYIALAEMLGTKVVTADMKLKNNVKDNRLIILLKDVQ